MHVFAADSSLRLLPTFSGARLQVIGESVRQSPTYTPFLNPMVWILRIASLPYACIPFLLTACGHAADAIPDAERTDSAGVSIILNSGHDRPLAWHYSARLTIGGEDDGPTSFYEVDRHLVAVDGRGDIIVLNRNEFRAVKFTQSGEFLLEVGGEGEGPGEFKRPVGVGTARDGNFAILDAGRARYIEFNAAGQLVAEVPAASRYSYLHLLDVGVISQRLSYLVDGSIEHLLLADAADTTILASIDTAETNSYQLEGCGPAPRTMGPVIFAPKLVWDGNWNSIAVNSNPAYVVNILDANGNFKGSVRRRIPVQNATVALAAQWAKEHPTRFVSSAGECVIDPEQVAEKRGFAPYMPLIGAVRLAPNGVLWVQRSAFVADSGKIDVFDASGQYLGTLADGTKMPIGFAPSGEALLVERDEVDIERLVIAEVVTGG